MLHIATFIISVIFASPLSIYWQDAAQHTVGTNVTLHKEFPLESYLEKGLTVTYRFHFRICRVRNNWLDHCGDDTLELHKIYFDPLTEIYTVALDRLGDDEQPEVLHTESKDQAIAALTRVKGIPLDSLDEAKESIDSGKKSYLAVRLESYSLEEGKNPVEWLSYLVTFGLVDLDRYDSGWIDVPLTELEPVS